MAWLRQSAPLTTALDKARLVKVQAASALPLPLAPFLGKWRCRLPCVRSYKQGTSWLGKNSTTNRLKNALGDVQIRMRLNVSGDRSEIRQTYLPVLMKQLSAPLAAQGQDGIEEVIALMDDYYLTKDEFDTVMELGLGDEFSGETLLKGVNAATKSALTRTCVLLLSKLKATVKLSSCPASTRASTRFRSTKLQTLQAKRPKRCQSRNNRTTKMCWNWTKQ